MGACQKADEASEKVTLTGKLLDLEATVKAAKPVSDALLLCGRLKQHLKSRRVAETRLGAYAIASAALANLAVLGQLADEQVDQLRSTLRKSAADWRSRIYLGAFPDTGHELVDTGMGRKGELDLLVQAGGVSAPAQHVTNASALRASLVAFFIAFWEYVLRERGGLVTLILDDPQQLLDDENRERLAAALPHLAAPGATDRDFLRSAILRACVPPFDIGRHRARARFRGWLPRAFRE